MDKSVRHLEIEATFPEKGDFVAVRVGKSPPHEAIAWIPREFIRAWFTVALGIACIAMPWMGPL